MTPEAGELLDKARDCLRRARLILAAGVGEDAGRDAYLAVFHAAQAVIVSGPEGQRRAMAAFIASWRNWDATSPNSRNSLCSCRKPTI